MSLKTNSKQLTKVDILENEILKKYPGVLDILLCDRTSKANILWGTNNYENLGVNYECDKYILPELITGENGKIIMPRVEKTKFLQEFRAKSMAEVFTTSGICNAQNNIIDDNWFNKSNNFNLELKDDNIFGWKINKEKIQFSKGKTWKDYVFSSRLEMACGEAPYLVSRYDTTIGRFISVENRIGILDRKLRVINENVEHSDEWVKYAKIACKNCYGYEWQGDNLLLAREAILVTFIENHIFKFNKTPGLDFIKDIAIIISWNIWQMDGLKGVVPYSCENEVTIVTNLQGQDEVKALYCIGCRNSTIKKHIGIYSIIMEWSKEDELKGKKTKFIDLL